ncbi:MAG TPA: hypothetical protein DD379_18210 [Cyanobacteria bacterium UBA11162]|nr:hypothetical protein [Cyanobacteria bacterium UBA12227]HAX85574.1 hypothetical protein [Cyanobacteria bacterium UBA11370]HBL13293.1 hypothetical protein [Cyanobacteria bacterium UBA11162]HBY77590.1 hypothetical protein [Cyanobacteria bacterium UBA11148]
MRLIHIHLFTILQDYLLLVFHTDSQCWQFRVTNSTGEIFGMALPYDSAEAAERVGRNWIDSKR